MQPKTGQKTILCVTKLNFNVMKQQIIAFILVTIGIFFVNAPLSYAQGEITYTYDAAGNRLGRTIMMSPVRQARAIDTMEEAESGTTEPIAYMDIIDKTAITIYPNPTQGHLTIDIDNIPEESSIRIYDMNGKILLQKSNIENSTEIDLSSQSSGSYILRIDLSGKTSTWKIIKQ